MWHTQLKLALEEYTGISRDALHVHAAIILYLVAWAALRRDVRSPVPWLIVFALEVLNEALDLHEQYVVGAAAAWRQALEQGWQLCAKDMLNTMLWPTLLLVAGRYTSLFERRRDGAQEESA